MDSAEDGRKRRQDALRSFMNVDDVLDRPLIDEAWLLIVMREHTQGGLTG